jgi:excisionase family DNA binding protein
VEVRFWLAGTKSSGARTLKKTVRFTIKGFCAEDTFVLTLARTIGSICCSMILYSTRQAAKRLGIDNGTLSRYISRGKIAAPMTNAAGGMTVHLWTEAEIEHVRQLLPKIANGRKTRYKKLKEKQKGEAPARPALRPKKKKS